MKTKNLGLLAAALCCGLLVNQIASAQTLTYNTTQTAINGYGNTDLGWSVYSSPTLTLATMAQWNYPGYPDNATAPSDPNDGNGTFIFPTGTKPPSLTRGNYDIWFSASTSTALAASGLDLYWSVTTTGPGTAYGPIPLSFYADSSYGDASTPNGGGTTGTYAAESGTYSLFQNAQDPSWLINGYDPNANQIVSVDIYAVASGAGADGAKVGEVTSTINVGNVEAVPEPSSIALASLGGLVAFLGIQRRRLAI
jgi:hypothetical protein